VDRPRLVEQPVIAGSGPADLTTKVYNLTAAELQNVKVAFWATVGQQKVLLAETTLPTLPAGAPTLATATWAAPMTGKWHIESGGIGGRCLGQHAGDGASVCPVRPPF